LVPIEAQINKDIQKSNQRKEQERVEERARIERERQEEQARHRQERIRTDYNDNLWKGFTFEATQDNTTIQYKYEIRTDEIYSRSGNSNCSTISGSLWYSYDASNWIKWNCFDNVTLNKGQKFYLKGNKPYYAILDNLYHYIEVTNGFVKGYGDISSLFDNTDNCTKTKFGDVALSEFFRGNCDVSLSFHEGVTEIGTTRVFSYAFRNNHNTAEKGYGITAIELPSTLTMIGCTSFENSQMKRITIPRSVTYIGSAAFNGCLQLQSVNYLGTIAEWNRIEKGNYKWGSPVPAKVVHCIDGDAPF
jgi:hypothetical protein